MGWNIKGRWLVGEGWQVPLEHWLMLGICSLRVLGYGSETVLWEEKERSRIRAVQMDNLRGLLGIMRMDRVPNAGITEFCGVTKGVDKVIEEGVLWWFGHVERMERIGLLRGYM